MAATIPTHSPAELLATFADSALYDHRSMCNVFVMDMINRCKQHIMDPINVDYYKRAYGTLFRHLKALTLNNITTAAFLPENKVNPTVSFTYHHINRPSAHDAECDIIECDTRNFEPFFNYNFARGDIVVFYVFNEPTRPRRISHVMIAVGSHLLRGTNNTSTFGGDATLRTINMAVGGLHIGEGIYRIDIIKLDAFIKYHYDNRS